MRVVLLINAAFEFVVAGLTLMAPQVLLGPVGSDARAVARVLAANAFALAVYSLLAALHRDLEVRRLALRCFLVFHVAVVAVQAAGFAEGGPVQPVIAHGLLLLAFAVAIVRSPRGGQGRAA